MKILITGSNGLLGQKLVYLLRDKVEVQLIATSRGENRIRERTGYEYYSIDITEKEQVEKAIGKFQPDVIINTAAMTNVDECEIKKEECRKQNVTAVQNLVDCISQHQTKNEKQKTHLIQLSTDFIFDGENGPYKEDDKPNPLSYYALSKYEAEKIIQSSKIKWAIARTIIVYGVSDFMSRSNIVLWAKSALEKGQPLNIVNDQWRMPTLAEDLAEGCWLIAQKGATGIYNLSGKDFMSIIELVNRVADFYGYDKSIISPVSSSTLNQTAKRPPKTGFILDKSIRELGYAPHSFEEGLKIVDEQLKANK